MKYDYIIVGTGFTGSVLGRKLADDGKRILMIEKRNHIAGNMYDEYENGILVQKYGPHIFHTKTKEVMQFLYRFSDFYDFDLKCTALIDDKIIPSPFNFHAIEILFPDRAFEIITELKKEYPKRDRVTIVELLNSSNDLIKGVAETFFEKDYKPYTAKQWGLLPSQVDISILKRVPIIFSYENSYFDDDIVCMPKNGYTALFQNMLDHANITIRLHTDFNYIARFKEKELYIDNEVYNGKVIYTGAIDAIFKYQFGNLPYRSLVFDYHYLKDSYFKDRNPIRVYPAHHDITRITEYKFLQEEPLCDGTIIGVERPREYKPNDAHLEPYYPIINDNNIALLKKYKKLADTYEQLILCGRLADYHYYNMDDAIKRAFEVYDEIVKGRMK